MAMAQTMKHAIKTTLARSVCQDSEVINKDITIKDAIYKECSQGLVPDNKRSTDERSKTGSIIFSTESGVKLSPAMKALVKEAADIVDLKEVNCCRIQYHVGFKNTGTIIKRPSYAVIWRVVYNLGNKEIYHFGYGGEKLVKLKKMGETTGSEPISSLALDNRDVTMNANTYVGLGHQSLCDFEISISARPPTHTPMEASSSSARSGKSMRFMRPPSYHRITIVIDFEETAEIVESLDTSVCKQIGKSTLKEIYGFMQQGMKGIASRDTGSDTDMTVSKREKKEIRKLMENGSEAPKKKLPSRKPQPAEPDDDDDDIDVESLM